MLLSGCATVGSNIPNNLLTVKQQQEPYCLEIPIWLLEKKASPPLTLSKNLTREEALQLLIDVIDWGEGAWRRLDGIKTWQSFCQSNVEEFKKIVDSEKDKKTQDEITKYINILKDYQIFNGE